MMKKTRETDFCWFNAVVKYSCYEFLKRIKRINEFIITEKI